MRRITPRTCLWPLVGCVSAAFALSIGLTYRSNHHCYAGTCGEWLFPLQARLHVVTWYAWLSISITVLSVRAFQPRIRKLIGFSLGVDIPVLGKALRLSGIVLVTWILALYGILFGIWWIRLDDYFKERGPGLSGNSLLAIIALTGHFADVTMGLVLLPVSRHSALASFFKLSPSTTYSFHMVMAYILIALVAAHGSIYAAWAAIYNSDKDRYRTTFPVLNPTYLYHEVWPGGSSSLDIWRASLIFTGLASAAIMGAMLCTSFSPIRRRYFNLFYFTHLLGIVAVVVICLHASTMLYCTLPGLCMWLLDWSMRLVELREKYDGQLRSIGNGWYDLALPLPRSRLSGCDCRSPLAHFYIHHSKSSIREIHPFTTITHLASEKPTTTDAGRIEIRFLFRESPPRTESSKRRQWTNKIASLVDEEKVEVQLDTSENDSLNLAPTTGTKTGGRQVHTAFRLEGPYFTFANPEQYDTVICLVAGTGLSGALAIAASFRARQVKCATVGTTTLPGPTASPSTACSSVPGARNKWQRCHVVWSVRESDYADIPFISELDCDGLEFTIHKTGPGRKRVDIQSQLDTLCPPGENTGWIYMSGPSSFITACEKACQRRKNLRWFAARWD